MTRFEAGSSAPSILILDRGLRVLVHGGTLLWKGLGSQLLAGHPVSGVLYTAVQQVVQDWGPRSIDCRAAVIHATPDVVVRVAPMCNGEADDVVIGVIGQRFTYRSDLRWAEATFNLSPREVEILRSVCSGRPTSAIARELAISSSTAMAHVKSLMVKTGAMNRPGLVAAALGWPADDQPLRSPHEG